MKQIIGFCQFTDAFGDMGRKDQFTYKGLKALYESLKQYEEDCGVEMELDVIALCCEYTEYESLEEFQDAYDNEQICYQTLEDIEDQTTVIKIDNDSFIIQDF